MQRKLRPPHAFHVRILETIDGSRLLPPLYGVYYHHLLPAPDKVNELHGGGAAINQLHAGGQLATAHSFHQPHTNPLVTEENVTHPQDKHRGWRGPVVANIFFCHCF